jgi:hypothetical protein
MDLRKSGRNIATIVYVAPRRVRWQWFYYEGFAVSLVDFIMY